MLKSMIKLLERPGAKHSSEPRPKSAPEAGGAISGEGKGIVSKELQALAKAQGVPLPDWYVDAAQVPLKVGPTRLFGETIDEPDAVVISGRDLSQTTTEG